MRALFWLLVLLASSGLVGWIFRHLSCLYIRRPDEDGRWISWAGLLKRARTGDLILFSGTGRDSAVVRSWSGSRWTHIGMVVRSDDSLYGTIQRLFLWNADSCQSRRNLLNGKYKEGVQLNDLRLYLDTYPGYAYYCPLMGGRSVGKDELKPLYRELSGKPFNHQCVELLRCTQGPGGGYLGRKQADPDKWFCSQLIAESLMFLGLMGGSIPTNEYHPASFVGEMAADWKEGVRPGPLYEIVNKSIGRGGGGCALDTPRRS